MNAGEKRERERETRVSSIQFQYHFSYVLCLYYMPHRLGLYSYAIVTSFDKQPDKYSTHSAHSSYLRLHVVAAVAVAVGVLRNAVIKCLGQYAVAGASAINVRRRFIRHAPCPRPFCIT